MIVWTDDEFRRQILAMRHRERIYQRRRVRAHIWLAAIAFTVGTVASMLATHGTIR